MKITSISVEIMGAPAIKGRGVARNWIFIRVETDEGLFGIGEATTEWHEHAVASMVREHFAPLLIGQDPTRINRVWQELWRGFHFRGGVVASSAASGIDQALWDIAGKISGRPVYKLLGGEVRDRVRLYARGDLGLPSQKEELETALCEGFTAFKVDPLDHSSEFKEAEQVEHGLKMASEARRQAGPSIDLMMDCAGVFSLQAAHDLISGVRGMGLLFIEEPVNADTPRLLAALRKAFPDTRIASGERVLTRWGFREWLEADAVDVIQADLAHCGGISELIRIAAFAEVYNVQIAPHNPYGPVATAANIHACAAIQNFLILEHCRLRPWFDQVQVYGPEIKDGYALLDDRPGLGVELDWEFVKSHPYSPLKMRLRFDKDGGLISQ